MSELANMGLHNPFESTFSLLRSLRDEVKDLKNEVNELRAQKIERFERLESLVAQHANENAERFSKMQANMDDMNLKTNKRFQQLSQTVEDHRRAENTRLDKLESQVRAEMKLRFDQVTELDKKMKDELKRLRGDLEKLGNEVFQHKQRTGIDMAANKTSCDELRVDVEKLAALLAENSMSKDPYNQLGYRIGTPPAPTQSLGCTARGSNLPPLISASKHNPWPSTSSPMNINSVGAGGFA